MEIYPLRGNMFAPPIPEKFKWIYHVLKSIVGAILFALLRAFLAERLVYANYLCTILFLIMMLIYYLIPTP